MTAGVSDKLRHLHRSPRRPLEEGRHRIFGGTGRVPETRVGSAGGAEMVAGCSTRSLVGNIRTSLSRLWVAIEFIVPAYCVAGAIVIWLDLPGSNPGGIASI